MKISASHTVNLGIAKLTFSRTGVTLSSGIPGLRASVNTKGQVGLRAGIPGTGLHFDKKKKLLPKVL
jgi:hypothetical protein